MPRSTSYAPGAPPFRTPADVVAFWQEAGREKWFVKDEAFDAEFRRRGMAAHFAAAARLRDDWLQSDIGALALVILLDQFPRNAFRGTAHMFATDVLARKMALGAIEIGADRRVTPELRPFFYLPLEHSEDAADQARCVELMGDTDADSLHWAEMHRDIISRFGRFPHRNAVLGRHTTPDEAMFLADGGFAG
ncbi:DUF924 family protein [Alcaligenaceae bacterium A4P071]|nr:DUF924 family protein [Alcaligenaceae bacterium B3P038]MDQ2186761.1 DUF924 family protein [Alcaligenaceae bacterium A4P071]